jgi:hypothetical protein
MVRSNRRRSALLGSLLAGVAGATFLLAAPVGAQTSGGATADNDSVASGTCVATNDSTCSGSGRATGDSTSSGSAVAIDGSTSSGCATAVNDSTASGAPCPSATTATTRPVATGGGTGGATTARPAASTATAGRSLALTGSDNGELAGAAALALVAGALLVRAAREDRTSRTA